MLIDLSKEEDRGQAMRSATMLGIGNELAA
jgi:hypothetical protein